MSEWFVHIQIWGMIQQTSRLYTLQFFFSITPTNHLTASMKEAYALRARPLVTPKPHAATATATATVSDLCNTVMTHSCVEMSHVSCTQEQ
jgi:hypothetical protein